MKLLVLFVATVLLFATLVNQYSFDMLGITIPGKYECTGKSISGGYPSDNIALTRPYVLSDIQRNAEKVGYHTWGDVDTTPRLGPWRGPWLNIRTTTSLASYSFTFGGDRHSGNSIDLGILSMKSTPSNNICTTPNEKIQRDIREIFSHIGVETDWLNSVKIERDIFYPDFSLVM